MVVNTSRTQFAKGNIPWNRGLRLGKQSDEHRKKLSLALKGKKKPLRTKEHALKLGACHKGMSPWNKGIHTARNRNINYLLRNTQRYRIWAEQVKKFYHNRCICCWKRGKTEAHHLIPLRELLKKHKTIETAIADENIWLLENGVSFCRKCHGLFDKFREKIIKKGKRQ